MENKENEYKGLDNRDLKLINLPPWDIPHPHRNPKVRQILDGIATMAPGSALKFENIAPDEVWLLRSAVWRQIKRHDIEVVVAVRGGIIYVEKP